MKTIEEAARQHCNRSQFKSDFPHDYHSEESGFKEGVEFAQRWIPVEEEMPEAGATVLLKIDNFDSVVGFYTYSQKFMGKLFLVFGISNIELTNVTHWRPIELK